MEVDAEAHHSAASKYEIIEKEIDKMLKDFKTFSTSVLATMKDPAVRNKF